MKKTMLLLLLPIIIGCSKDSATSCSYNADALKGKSYKLTSTTIDSSSVRILSYTYNDSFQYTYSFSDGTTGLHKVKYISSGPLPTEYSNKIDYTVFTGSNDLQIVEWNSSTSKNTYIYKVESFDCSKMVLYSTSTNGTILYERRETYTKQ